MFKIFQYQLQPAEQERNFLASRLDADKRKMGRVYRLALCIVFTFLILGFALLPPSWNTNIILLSRAGGVAATLIGLLTLRRIESRRVFEWIAFACLGWLSIQFAIVQLYSFVHSETLLAWNVFMVFIIYLTVPVSLSFRLACAVFLSMASIAVWLYNKESLYDPINSIGMVSVYLATNAFGIICAWKAARTEREEFQYLQCENQLKANLETTYARLEESVESRNQIYRVLAHDLRSGIGALGSIGHLLAEGKNNDEEEREKLIDLICESAKSSYELLDNMLQWAISESGSVDPNPVAISLDHSVTNCVGFLKVLAHDKKVDLEVRIDEPATVWADSKMLDTVIRNLTSNAIKFTKPTGTVRIAAKEGKEGFVVISVTDTGVGIDEERLARIFNLKYGENSPGTSGERGTNLGLRICQEFVGKLGGKIWVTSKVGVGSQFSFTVPSYPGDRVEG